MKKVFLNPLIILVMVAITSLACTSKYPGFDKTATGLYYKLYKVSKDTAKAKTGDYISIDMRYTTAKDSLLFDSKVMMKGAPVKFQLPASDFKGDIYEGITLMSPGDSAVFLVNADSLFRKTFRQPKLPPFVDSTSVIKFYITLLAADTKEMLEKKETEALQKYLSDHQITAQPKPSGLYFIETTPGTGMKIDSGSMVKFQFTVGTVDGKQVYSSYDRGEPMSMQYGKPFDNVGFDEGIGYMRKGEKATFIVPSSIGFGAQGRGSLIGPYTTIIYNVEIVDVESKAEYEKQQEAQKKEAEQKKASAKAGEMGALQKYLKDNNITAKPTADGLYYIEKVKGTGPRAVAGKKVKVHYTGTLLDGTKFDSSRDRGQPFEFTLGEGQVIKGWDEGIAMMNVGGRATLIIPSSIGYGDRSMGKIPPYSTLVFDVELLGVE
jgi:FKBP-type peptidyl-prolyl cis-trans isomerase